MVSEPWRDQLRWGRGWCLNPGGISYGGSWMESEPWRDQLRWGRGWCLNPGGISYGGSWMVSDTLAGSATVGLQGAVAERAERFGHRFVRQRKPWRLPLRGVEMVDQECSTKSLESS